MKYMIILLFALISCSPNTVKGIEISDVWIREVPQGSDVTALYMEVKNNGKEDFIVSISSPVSEIAEVHSTEISPDGNAVMVKLESVVVPEKEVLSFKPGGKHIMLINLKEPLKAGDSYPVEIEFKNSGKKSVNAEVKGLGGNAHDHSHH